MYYQLSQFILPSTHNTNKINLKKKDFHLSLKTNFKKKKILYIYITPKNWIRNKKINKRNVSEIISNLRSSFLIPMFEQLSGKAEGTPQKRLTAWNASSVQFSPVLSPNTSSRHILLLIDLRESSSFGPGLPILEPFLEPLSPRPLFLHSPFSLPLFPKTIWSREYWG